MKTNYLSVDQLDLLKRFIISEHAIFNLFGEPKPLRVDEWIASLDLPVYVNDHAIAAFRDGELVAFMVREEMQGEGWGTALLAELPETKVAVLDYRRDAIEFFKKRGFEIQEIQEYPSPLSRVVLSSYKCKE